MEGKRLSVVSLLFERLPEAIVQWSFSCSEGDRALFFSLVWMLQLSEG